MSADVSALKQRLSLLEYLRQHNWVARPVGSRHEYVGCCPLHPDTHPSFYVNAVKDVFFCHGCGQGGDLIRFLQLSLHLSFPQAVAHLREQLGCPPLGEDEALQETAGFYQQQLQIYPQALDYLRRRGLDNSRLITRLRIGYAPGGVLGRHLCRLGYPVSLLNQLGLVYQGRDAFSNRIVFPCVDTTRVVNLYGRSLGRGAPHRFLPRPKGGLFDWGTVRQHPAVILVEGLWDLALLWQAGFVQTTCAYGVHLTAGQFTQLIERRDRPVFLGLDADPPGRQAAAALAHRLRSAGMQDIRLIDWPKGQDPNTYFLSGASAADVHDRLRSARRL